ncbi:hypothetical protein niasHT_029212 [Heterodera trifolii]|uniref:Glycosyl hydrolase family 13 catalytic domain-containing protein n=1 Tax=Heterodera trifolii TaxID=157864 RepID=A0ABD2JZX9_9BILA
MVMVQSGQMGKETPRGASKWENKLFSSFGDLFTRRLASRVDGKEYTELIMLLQLALPGTPIIYYGDELGLRDVLNLKFPQGGPMPWALSSPFDN